MRPPLSGSEKLVHDIIGVNPLSPIAAVAALILRHLRHD